MKHLFAMVAFFWMVMVASLTFGSVSYTITDLGTLGGSASYAFGLNNSGQVVGTAFTTGNLDHHAFLYSNGQMTDLNIFGGTTTVAMGISNNGTIVGGDGFDTPQGFPTYNGGNYDDLAWSYSNGQATNIGDLSGGTFAEAHGVNNNGLIVGASGGTIRGFLYQNGTMTDFAGRVGNSNAFAINVSGQIAGVYKGGSYPSLLHGFIYSNGVTTSIGSIVQGVIQSGAYGINNAGDVVGYDVPTTSGYEQAMLYQNGQVDDLGTLSGVASLASIAYGINNENEIVGMGYVAFQVQNAFIGFGSRKPHPLWVGRNATHPPLAD